MSDLPRRTRAEQQAATRRRLLDAAQEVFAEHGFDGASIDEICTRAGFSRGAFYSNFSDKADLLITLCERRATAFADVELPGFLALPEPERIGAVARWLAQDPFPLEVFLLVELARQRRQGPEAADAVDRVMDAVTSAIEGLMTVEGSGLAHLPPEEIRIRARAILAALLGLDLLGQLGIRGNRRTIELLLAGVSADEAALLAALAPENRP